MRMRAMMAWVVVAGAASSGCVASPTGEHARGGGDPAAARTNTTTTTEAPRPTPTAISGLVVEGRSWVRGRVDRIVDTDEFVVRDATGEVRVWVPWQHAADVRVGEVVLVEGVVDRDLAGRLEIDASRVIREGSREALGVVAVEALVPLVPTAVVGRVDAVLDEDEIRLRDKTGTVRVFLGERSGERSGVTVVPGETIRVEGVLDRAGVDGRRGEFYAGVLIREDGRRIALQRASEEVVSGDAGASPGARAAAPLAAAPLAASPAAAGGAGGTSGEGAAIAIASLRRGQSGMIRGEVVRVTDSDEFRMRDGSGSVRVYIGYRNAMPVGAGESVTVWGRLDDDGVRPEFYATRIRTGDGRVVNLLGDE